MQLGSEGVEVEFERRRDPEVPAGAADAPEQLGLLGLARADEPAVGGDELDRSQAVDRQPEAPLQPADPATERQPGDAGVADHAGRADQTMRLGRDVELAEERAAVRPGDARHRIHGDAAHPRQVHDEAAVTARVTGGAVAAGADGQGEVVLAREADGGGDVRVGRRPDDDGRPTIVDGVPQPAGLVVACRRPA